MGSFYMESTQINYRRDETVKTVDQKLQELSETSAIDTDIAPVFKSTNTYSPGDMVYYRNKLYVFNVEHTGAWAAADVTATDVTTEISSLNSGLTNYQTQNDINLEVPNRKNILNLSFEKIKALCNEGTWTGTSYVYNGVTFVFTVVDGYITKISISGTLTDNRSRVWIAYNEDMSNYNGCILNGCPDLGGTDYISIQIQKTGTPYTTYAVDTGSGANINNISNNCQIYISIGASFDSQTPVDVYPMIRPAIITDSTFVPYIPSVESRIEAVESNNFGTVVDLSAYQQGDKYTCLSDGYAVAYAPANGNVTYRLYGASGSEFIYNSIEASNEQTSVIYVKKGMRLELRAISGTSASFKFYPFAS